MPSPIELTENGNFEEFIARISDVVSNRIIGEMTPQESEIFSSLLADMITQNGVAALSHKALQDLQRHMEHIVRGRQCPCDPFGR